jgi:hypothetical protein
MTTIKEKASLYSRHPWTISLLFIHDEQTFFSFKRERGGRYQLFQYKEINGGGGGIANCKSQRNDKAG